MVRKLNRGSNPLPGRKGTLPRGPARRRRRAVAVRGAILRAAASVFRSRGFFETGMREIAEAADLSPGNLYYYFASKTDILYFCQDHSVGRMLELARAAQRRRLTPPARLRRIVVAHLLCTLDELDGAAAHTEVDALPLDLRRRIVAKRDRYERAVRRVVRDGVRASAFRKCDPILVTRALLGACNWTTRWYRPGGRLTPQAIADAYADYLLKGLVP